MYMYTWLYLGVYSVPQQDPLCKSKKSVLCLYKSSFPYKSERITGLTTSGIVYWLGSENICDKILYTHIRSRLNQCMLIDFDFYNFFKYFSCRFSPEMINNNTTTTSHQIAVVCAQCYSHIFVQHAKCVPASDPVFHFIPLTTGYQPYLVNPELPEKIPWVKWDTRSFLKSLLLSPRRSISSEDYVLGPTSSSPRPGSRGGGYREITQSPTSPW